MYQLTHVHVFRIAAAFIAVAILSACAPGSRSTAIPRQLQSIRGSTEYTPPHLRGKDFLIKCTAPPLARVADCAGRLEPLPDYATAGDQIIDGKGNQLLFEVNSQKWFHKLGHFAISHESFLKRHTSSVVDCLSGLITDSKARAVRLLCIYDAPPPPEGSTMGGDGEWYTPYGTQLAYLPDSGTWIQVVAHVNAHPAYDPSLQPYVTAGQFADAIEPWFYSFSLPLDIPVGGLVGRFGGGFLAKVAQKNLQAYLSKVSAVADDMER
ncbi:MAG: hypothetical protein JOZ24_02570, partial [Candidatus Eremiobacteraeota bacterium]|nr:hypothetical protein [Candidatus Eremiobacteraeota bacterium]